MALPPGSYVVQLEAEGLAPATVGPVDLVADHEVRLDELELMPFATLGVEVAPPLDPHKQRWNLSLTSVSHSTESLKFDEEGSIKASDLPPGEYVIEISSSRDDLYFSERRPIGFGDQMRVELDLVRIDGHLTMDGEPLEADLALGAGARDRVELKSDAEGRFVGWLRTPETPFLWVQVTALDGALSRLTRPPVPPIKDGVLPLRIELEDLRLAGQVVRSNGLPVSGADVRMTRERLDDYTLVSIETDSDGRFVARGLPRVELMLQAFAPENPETGPLLSSVGVRAVPVRDELGGDHRLVIQRGREVEGLLLDAAGRFVPAALLHVLSFGAAPLEAEADTGLGGRFRVRLAPYAVRANVIVAAPSQFLWAGCLELPPEESGPWMIQLPGGPGGELNLRDASSTSRAEGREFPQYAVLTFDGGVLAMQHLVSWANYGGGAHGLLADPPFLKVRGVAPGLYAPFVNELPFPGLAHSVCAVGARPKLPWQTLSAGGSLTFELDLPSPQELGGEFPFSQ